MERTLRAGARRVRGILQRNLCPALHFAQRAALRRHLQRPLVGKADVFVWAVIDWHFRIQRPQQLSRALAERQHRVFYVSNEFIDAASPGFSVERLDDTGRLFQVRLHVPGAPAIYRAMPDAVVERALRASISMLREWTSTRAPLSLIDHPFWSGVVRELHDARHVYDCMDHHAGFKDNADGVIAAEAQLVRTADLVVVTSGWLQERIEPQARRIALVRNGCEPDAFRTPPPEVFADPRGRRVVGYFGAIDTWFDTDLVAAVASACPDIAIVLIGRDTVGARERLAGLDNVSFKGERSYAELPFWVHGFDVCLLPFQVLPLTLATNPVKVYEYLAAGKPVVGTALPEMRIFGELVRTASSPGEFVAAVRDALLLATDPAPVPGRQAFAAEHTWSRRVDELAAALNTIPLPANTPGAGASPSRIPVVSEATR